MRNSRAARLRNPGDLVRRVGAAFEIGGHEPYGIHNRASCPPRHEPMNSRHRSILITVVLGCAFAALALFRIARTLPRPLVWRRVGTSITPTSAAAVTLRRGVGFSPVERSGISALLMPFVKAGWLNASLLEWLSVRGRDDLCRADFA